MDITLLLSLGSTVVAVAALVIAATALWKTHFARFEPIVSTGGLRQRIYPIRSENDRWYLASFDLPLVVANKGAVPGRVSGLRLCLEYRDLPIPENRELVPATWEIDLRDARKISRDRFEWLNKLRVYDWLPFIVLPKQTVAKHFIFEVRWEDPVIQKNVQCFLELATGSEGAWIRIARWRLGWNPETWGELANVGTSLTLGPLGSMVKEPRLRPPDLHKYTGSKEPIPEEGYGAGSSYLDYPER